MGDLVMGRNCVTELIRRSPERVREVFLSEALDHSRSGRNDRRRSLLDEIERLDIAVREVSRRDLDSMVQSDSHQGVVARVTHRPMLEFDALIRMVRDEPSARILALDGVLDPQNFGAMLRAAECFGVTAVVWSKNRGAPIGPVVSKVSVGGSELVRLCPVSNLHRALEALKEAGAWSVGAMVAPDATPLDRFEFPDKCVLVMGSEGEGVQHLIEKSLDFRVYILMCGQIDSLNVSQATAVLLQALSNQHRQKGLLKVT
jgi:23S rRNA (guanosine2251-2'-O)-methyltransferase